MDSSQKSKELIEQLSLLLVMTSPGEAAGVALLFELINDVAIAAAGAGELAPLESAAKEAFAKRNDPEHWRVVEEFAANAIRFLDSPSSAVFSATSGTQTHTAPTSCDMSADIDPSFLAEFIETHTLLLDEFESNILDYERGQEDSELFETAVKRYLHNLKGDSGSIGLLGLQKASHAIEDLLTEGKAAQLIPQLLQFKEWATSCLRSYATGTAPPESSDAFLARLKTVSVTANKPGLKPAPAEALAQAPTPPAATAPASQYQITGDKDVLLEFCAEAEEHLNNVESIILGGESGFSKDSIDTIFRGVHSLKGGSAYFNLEETTKCSHILENFLSEVRDGKRELDPALLELALTYIDLQKSVLANARKAAVSDGTMNRLDASTAFLTRLEQYASGTPQQDAAQPARVAAASAPEELNSTPDKDTPSSKLNIKEFVKVDTARLDHLIDSIGEMVIYSSMLIRHCEDLLGDNEELMDITHRVEKFSRDLQDIGMSMRLVPIKGLFQKMSRLVWDTSKKIGKDIVFTMEGEDTELDRNLIDKLADPLMHMVRNSLDHGIELPDDRVHNGKPRTGQVHLAAYHSGGSIHIQIRDDGRGLNPEKLRAKAEEKGLIEPGQLLSEQETFQLIFAPGFSTAAAVTDISGRGVGMDVVRRNVESLRGRIRIQSEVNVGSTFTIEIPLTLAIMDGIQVRVGEESLILPSLSIVEFVRPSASMISETLDCAETLLFRDRYLPLYRLADLYGFRPQFTDPLEATLVVVENDSQFIALMVDEIVGQYSTVIKSLGPTFSSCEGLAGCAIMPSGDVALILDIHSLGNLARTSYKRQFHNTNATSVEARASQSVALAAT